MDEPDQLANEGWFNSRWRPAMGWLYGLICACDFIVFPVLSAGYYGPEHFHEWHPLTLQGGGLFHMAMGAIVGVAAWRRSDEKLAIYDNVGGTSLRESTSTVRERTIDQVTPVNPTNKSSRAD